MWAPSTASGKAKKRGIDFDGTSSGSSEILSMPTHRRGKGGQYLYAWRSSFRSPLGYRPEADNSRSPKTGKFLGGVDDLARSYRRVLLSFAVKDVSSAGSSFAATSGKGTERATGGRKEEDLAKSE
jgi:hypothetical protein